MGSWKNTIGGARVLLAAAGAVLAVALSLAWGAATSLASTTAATYFEDSSEDLCVGGPSSGGFVEGCNWGSISGYQNSAVGFDALFALQGGSENVADGDHALYSDTNGYNNLASGYGVLYHNTTGAGNVGVGHEALYNNTTGDDNIAIGQGPLYNNTTGEYNIAIGYGAGEKLPVNANHDIDIFSRAEAGDLHTTRIGTEQSEAASGPQPEYFQSRAFMAGIYNATITGKTCTVKINEHGQLACKVEKVKKEKAEKGDELAALQARVGAQQTQIKQLAAELKALRK